MLYHGSKIAGLKTLKPFPHDRVEGKSVVFATPDIRFALAMIHGTSDDLAVGYFVDQVTHKEEMYIEELVPRALDQLSAPGIIYTLEDSGFSHDERLSHVEVVSKFETGIISETSYPNILEELRKYDIRFVQYNIQ